VTVKFDATIHEYGVADDIAKRARKLGIVGSRRDIQMDIIAVHANGCPLRLDELAAADDFNFTHDVAGIRRSLDRSTGQLGDCFMPRFAVPVSEQGR
jgi:hypothetical protein